MLSQHNNVTLKQNVHIKIPSEKNDKVFIFYKPIKIFKKKDIFKKLHKIKDTK